MRRGWPKGVARPADLGVPLPCVFNDLGVLLTDGRLGDTVLGEVTALGEFGWKPPSFEALAVKVVAVVGGVARSSLECTSPSSVDSFDIAFVMAATLTLADLETLAASAACFTAAA